MQNAEWFWSKERFVEMKKADVLAALVTALKEELNETVAASKDAASYATDAESRAESKWDTQGLEASYLAAGQASQARGLATALQALESHRADLLRACLVVELGALVTVAVNGFRDLYYIVPTQGGVELSVDDSTVTTLTLQTPLGQALRGKAGGAQTRLPSGVMAELVAVA